MNHVMIQTSMDMVLEKAACSAYLAVMSVVRIPPATLTLFGTLMKVAKATIPLAFVTQGGPGHLGRRGKFGILHAIQHAIPTGMVVLVVL